MGVHKQVGQYPALTLLVLAAAGGQCRSPFLLLL
jgi:hypothetical protein